MKSLDQPACKAEIVTRIGGVRPDSPRRWGTMTSPQMLCHLSDSYLGVMGEIYISPARPNTAWTLIKWIALRAPVPWPKGVPTRPEIDQTIGGTPPADFEQDRQRVLALVDRFTRQPRDFSFCPHPMFGAMSVSEWMRWGYLHADHHLRQFGM